MYKFILKILSFFDFYHQFKIFKFLKKKGFKKFDIFFDIGAHKGESIVSFLKNFQIKKIYSFEASPENFKVLLKNKVKFDNKFKNTSIILENLAIGSSNEEVVFKQSYESMSSTFTKINQDSKYYKKKINLFRLNRNENFFKDIMVQLFTLDQYLNKNNISKVDFLKTDTEGYEYDVLLGLKDNIKKVSIIMFEHHYDDMLNKNYTFRDINKLLKKNNFDKIFKLKMPFRKTFEYIYINRDLI